MIFSLRDFLNNNCFIKKEDHLYNYKFETLFENLKNNLNILYYKPNWSNTKKDLIQIFANLRQYDKSFLLMTNGDVDIPCIKETWFNQDHIPFSEQLQTEIENKNLNDFLELDLLDLIPSNCTIYCNSVIKKTNNLNMIPLGRDFKGEPFSNNFVPNFKKINLCYYNCSIPPRSIHWYGRIREYIFKDAKTKNYILCENIFLNNGRNIGKQSFENYYQQIASSKFMICPRGCGLDTYRMWDCLYYGCIPIVVKYEGYQDMNDLPILFVNNWKEYFSLSENYLNDAWDKMLDKKYNYDKISFNWWKNKIEKDIQS